MEIVRNCFHIKYLIAEQLNIDPDDVLNESNKDIEFILEDDFYRDKLGDIELMKKFLAGDFNLSDEDLLFLLPRFHELECECFKEILIILKMRKINLDNFGRFIREHYNNIVIGDTLPLSFVLNDLPRAVKLTVDEMNKKELKFSYDYSIKTDNVEIFSIVYDKIDENSEEFSSISTINILNFLIENNYMNEKIVPPELKGNSYYFLSSFLKKTEVV